jgi:hypothetical protein
VLALGGWAGARWAFAQGAQPPSSQAAPAPPSPSKPPPKPTFQPGQSQPVQLQPGEPQLLPLPSKPKAPPQKPTGIARWLNPATAPFIPVPEIDEDPYSGTTVGVIPTFLVNNDRDEISQIIAPDVIYNQYFGWGARGRVYSFPSENTQWSIEGGAKQRVESEFDGEYTAGILRQDLWSFALSVIYDRNGSPRFYGLGNNTKLSGQTNFTDQQKYIQTILGLNVTHEWQVGYTFRARTVDIGPGRIATLPSIQELYPNTVIRAEREEILHRLSISYDSRDNVIAPTRGAEWVLYAGAASGEGFINTTLYSETGIDGRDFWSLGPGVLAVHFALRYMPGNNRTHAIPFWALSSIGGDESVIGGDQPLRGFGTGRFIDRNSSSMSAEYRWRLTTLNAFATQVSVEVTPFVDMGRVFDLMGDDPFSQLHKVAGIGLRGLALPFVVGYLDVGYGTEGAAIFTGLNYPF